MSAESRYETFEIVLRAPARGVPLAAAAKTLLAVERLYTLATLVEEPQYGELLARRLCHPERSSVAYTGREAPRAPDMATLADLLADADRLRLVDDGGRGAHRLVLAGASDSVRGIDGYLRSLDVRRRLEGDGGAERERAEDVAYEERLRSRVFALDVSPWYRGCLLALLSEAVTGVRAAAFLLAGAAHTAADAVTGSERTSAAREQPVAKSDRRAA
jgi:hypothetical protein